MRQVPAAAIDFIKDEEKCVLAVYQGAADRPGLLTAGYGHTGPELKLGMKVTQAMANAWLKEDLAIAAKRLNAVIPDVVPDLTSNQYAALISFVFNLGVDTKWTIWKVLRARKFDQVPAQLARFVYSAGKKRNGLVRRRNGEIALWSKGEPGVVVDEQPSSVTREVETPPAPASKPMEKASLVTKVVGGAAGLGAAAKQVNDVIEPHSYTVPLFAKISAVLAVVVVLSALVGLWLQHKRTKA